MTLSSNSSDNAATRRIVVGWSVNDDAELSDAARERQDRIYKLLYNRPIGIPWFRVSHGVLSASIFLTYYLYLLSRDKEAAHSIRRLCGYARDYFFGEWRSTAPSGSFDDEPPNADYQRRMSLWSAEYLHSSVWASVVGDWPLVEQLATYPFDGIRRDPEQSEQERAWLLTLAAAIRGEDAASQAEHVELIRDSRSRRENLLLNMLLGIQNGRKSTADAAASAYFKYYLRAERRRNNMFNKSMFDGTLLIGLATRNAINIRIPGTLAPYIVSLSAEADFLELA